MNYLDRKDARKAKIVKKVIAFFGKGLRFFTIIAALVIGLVSALMAALNLTILVGAIGILTGLVHPNNVSTATPTEIVQACTIFLFVMGTVNIVWAAFFCWLSRKAWPNKYWFSKLPKCSCECNCGGDRRIA